MFEFIDGLATWLESFVDSRWALVALVFVSASESIASPIPPDPILIPMAILRPNMAIIYSLVAALASVLGAIVGHWLGARFGRPLLARFVSSYRITKAEALFQKYGVWAVLVAAVTPIPYKVFAILSGVLHLDLKPFIIASLVGRCLRFLLLGVLLYFFGGEVQHFLKEYFHELTVLSIVGILLSILFLWVVLKMRGKSSTS